MPPHEGERRLPSFIVIGAIKAATTWISHHLRQSPDVFMPAGEPHYFSREYGRGLDWYLDHFADAEPSQIVGEKTADYLANRDAPKRASRLIPDASLILSLRNPVDRAYSDYCMLFRRGSVSGRIEEYLDPRLATFRRFLENGLYFTHVRAWLDHYSRDRLLVLTMEDVVDTPEETLQCISRFIGLSEAVVNPDRKTRVNDSGKVFLPLRLRKLLAPLKRAVRPLRGRAGFETVRAAFARPIRYPRLNEELRQRLTDFYHDDVDRLQELLGRDLAHWTADGSIAQVGGLKPQATASDGFAARLVSSS